MRYEIYERTDSFTDNNSYVQRLMYFATRSPFPRAVAFFLVKGHTSVWYFFVTISGDDVALFGQMRTRVYRFGCIRFDGKTKTDRE